MSSTTSKTARAAVVCVAFAAAAVPSFGQTSSSGMPDGFNVRVLNTPLPVTGTVSGQVTVAGQPNVVVTNTAANPVPTRDLSNVRQPYSFFGHCDSSNGNGCQIETLAIPAGKRLVLQFVNGSIQAATGNPLQNFNVFVGGGSVLFLLARPSGVTGTTLSNYSINETVLAYVEAGQKITVSASMSNTGINVIAYLAGYLVDAN